MSSRYHCAFVALVTLLAVILIGFLLLFTDLGFSPSVSTEGHLSNGNIWAAKRLRVSAELAYYWGNSAAVREGERVSSDVSVLQEREGLTEKVTSERADLTSDVQSEMAEKVSSVMKERVVLTEKGEQDTKREHGNRQTQLTVGKSFRQEEELSRESFDESLKSSAESNTRLNQTSQNRHDATTERSSRTTATNNSERRKGVFVDLAATPAVGNTTAVNMETLTSEEKQKLSTPYAVADDDDDGKDLFSEVDDQYSLEDDSADDASDPYYAEDEDDSDEEINLAFENNIDKEKETNVHSNATQNHPLLGSIKPELIERASNVQFHMPCPKVYHAVTELVVALWMKPLLRVLSSFEGKQVTLVIANNAYRDVLVNWLISARIVSRPPIDNILVVCLDHTLYRLLQSRDIPSILAPFSTVLNSKYRFRRFFELIMMMRLGFMRLINRLGYDCAMYDIDAIILKNPQPLYDNHWRDRDIVGSRGELPRALWRKWGVAICIGVVFIRSNPRTGIYSSSL